ncbi:MAG: beta-galactosidase, partial [Flavobacteriaceae bacterium]
MKKVLIVTLILLINFTRVYGQSISSERKVVNLNENWFYLEDNNPKVSEIQTSNLWLPITLPHSWNSFDATDVVPGYRRDASWYKKNLEVKNLDTSKRYVLYFEGSNITTKVYVNEQFAGEHVGGYLGFDIEITKFLKPQGKNE